MLEEETQPSSDIFNQHKENSLIEITSELIKRNETFIQEINKFIERKTTIDNAIEGLNEGDQDEGLLDRIRLNIGGYYYDIRHREDLFRREGFPLNYLFKKKWEKYLMKDRSGRIYIDTEPCVFLALLKWIEDDIVQFPGIYWQQINRFITSEFHLQKHICAKISGLEYLTNFQSKTLINLLKKLNFNCSQLQQIASVEFTGSYQIDEEHFMIDICDQENVLLVFRTTENDYHAMISDRALFLGRKSHANSHTTTSRFYANLTDGKHFQIQSLKVGNGRQVLPIFLSSSTRYPPPLSLSTFDNCLFVYPPDGQKLLQFSITKIECYTFLPYSTQRGGILTSVPAVDPTRMQEDPSLSIRMDLQVPKTTLNTVHQVFTTSSEVMKAYEHDIKEIKHSMKEVLYVGMYYEWIWSGLLSERTFTGHQGNWEIDKIDEVMEIIQKFKELKTTIKNFLTVPDSSTITHFGHDHIVSFSVEGERLCLLRKSICTFIPESVLGIRVSGRWTEHPEDLDEEGSIYIDFPKEIFKPLVRALRQSCRFDRARIDSGKAKSKPVYRIPSNKQAEAMAMFDYYQIPQGLFTWIFVPKEKLSDPLNP